MSETPTARALRVLELLQARPAITAARLADRLGVSERAEVAVRLRGAVPDHPRAATSS